MDSYVLKLKSPKSHPAWNKGVKGIHLSPKTEFKKGHAMSPEIRRKISDTLKLQKEKRHNWKGGITPINYKIRDSIEYKDWRNAVYRRDYWSCLECGKKCHQKEIVAHHIMLFSEYPQHRFLVKNGRTMCRECHARLHKIINLFKKNVVYNFNR